MIKKTLMILIFCMTPLSCFADVYQYQDNNGVMHLTNVVPSVKKYKLLSSNHPNKIAAMPSTSSRNSKRYDRVIRYHSDLYGMDPHLVKAVMKAESNFNPHAKSHKGAQGLMQLMPDTAKLMKVQNPFDPEENIKGGVGYLKALHNAFRGDIDLTLAAYNAGPMRVFGHNMQVPPISETRNYIKRVKYYYDMLKHSDDL